MGIHCLEFENMYAHFEKDQHLKLSDAVHKWQEIKDIGKDTMLGWKELLDEVATDLINHGYSLDEAKKDTWRQYYEAMAEDSTRWQFKILDIKEWFFNIYRRYPCKNCGYFTWDSMKDSGYCNNYCIEISNKTSRCISEDE